MSTTTLFKRPLLSHLREFAFNMILVPFSSLNFLLCRVASISRHELSISLHAVSSCDIWGGQAHAGLATRVRVPVNYRPFEWDGSAFTCEQKTASSCYLLLLFSSLVATILAVHGRDIEGRWVTANLMFCGWASCRAGQSFSFFVKIGICTKWWGCAELGYYCENQDHRGKQEIARKSHTGDFTIQKPTSHSSM